MKHLYAALVMGCALAGSVAAQEPMPDVDGLQLILEQQRALQSQLAAGSVKDLTPRQARQVREAQAEVFSMTEGKARLSELSLGEKIRLDNALERINALVTGDRGKQDVCWRERTTGSSMGNTRCGTQAERDQAREDARGYLERPRVCIPPGCS